MPARRVKSDTLEWSVTVAAELACSSVTRTDYLRPLLERAGFAMSVERDGEAALKRVSQMRPDVVVLDVIMPGVDGREVCRRMRAGGDWTPVIMLTQVDSPLDRVQSLEEGADDYLGKPFDIHELVARIRALLRRRRQAASGRPLSMAARLRSGEAVLDRRRRRLEIAGQRTELTPKALALLEFLMLHPDELLTRERLLDAVWSWDFPAVTRVVDVRIAELRRALGDSRDEPVFIDTEVGSGYRFIAPVEPEEVGQP